jgi:DNA-binding NarL/FixJ family response regulator
MNISSAKMAAIRVAVVDDDDEIRAGFMDLIARTPGLCLAASFSEGETALAELPDSKPDVVLMDINLPGMDGVECVRALKNKMPEAHFIMLTVYQDSNRLMNSLMAGASGYLLKRTSPAKLIQAIREVRSGGAPMTPEMARRLVQYFHKAPTRGANLPPLSPRENDVLSQLSKGYTYKEIAEHLQIGVGTLQRYIACIYDKMHVHSRTEAVVKYLNVSP